MLLAITGKNAMEKSGIHMHATHLTDSLPMAAKKTAKKTTDSVAKKAAKKAPAKKAAVKKTAGEATTKKAPAKKAAVKKPATATKAKKAPAHPSPDVLARAAYLNYRRRVEQSLPGDAHGDWLEAVTQLTQG